MTDVPTSAAHEGVWARSIRSLHHPNYRRFVAGHAVSVIGTWMQRVAQDWLVLQLTGSAVAIGTATALQFLPVLLFGAWGGLLADRWDRWRLLVLTQAASLVLAVLLAAATLAGVASLGLVYALALALGVVTVLDNPARQAFVTDLVPPTDYVNAQALNSTIHNAGRLIGPAVAGVLIAWVGAGAAFTVNAVSFVAVLAGLARIDRATLRRTERLPRGRGQVRAGLRYAWGAPEIRATLLLVGVVGVFGQNFRVVLPITASETLGGDAATYGWLTAALGAGAVVGAVGTATRERVTGRGLLGWTVAFGAVNLLVALGRGLPVLLLGMIGIGVTNIVFNTVARSLLQLHADPAMQGRVMALHGLLFLGSTPIGGPLLGLVCELAGAPWAYVLAGATALAVAAAVTPQVLRAGRAPVRPLTTAPPG